MKRVNIFLRLFGKYEGGESTVSQLTVFYIPIVPEWNADTNCSLDRNNSEAPGRHSHSQIREE